MSNKVKDSVKMTRCGNRNRSEITLDAVLSFQGNGTAGSLMLMRQHDAQRQSVTELFSPRT